MSAITLTEAKRVMTICNACRYCEGFCAVFPAMELHRAFTDGDLKYLSNLCHNCRDCYYACQYAPPHEFMLNFPKAMADLRVQTYQENAWPGWLGGLFRKNALAMLLTSVLSVLLVILGTGLLRGPETLFGRFSGPNAFYQVIPYLAMVIPFSLLAVVLGISLFNGLSNYVRTSRSRLKAMLHGKANLQAIWDALRLKYLDGGGYGCNYPDDRFSLVRKYLHHGVFYGFMLCLASTTVAAIYDHFLHIPAPYPLLSWPVILGSVGGLAVLIGTGGLLLLKRKMDRLPGAQQSLGMDVSFLILLFLVSLSGLALLALRETGAMGLLLTTHIGLVLAFFI